MNQDEIKLAQIGYQSAIEMLDHTGNLIWSCFNAMVLTNSIIIASISILASSSNLSNKFIFCLIGSIIGIFIVYYWLLLLGSQFYYYYYYMCSAKEFETKYLAPTVIFLNRGGEEISINNFMRECKILGVERKGKTRKFAERIIILFGIIYFLILVLCLFVTLNDFFFASSLSIAALLIIITKVL